MPNQQLRAFRDHSANISEDGLAILNRIKAGNMNAELCLALPTTNDRKEREARDERTLVEL